MMNLSQCQAGRKISSWCAALSRYQFRHQYDMTLSLYDSSASEAPSCSHTTKGDVRICVWKLLALIGAFAVFCSALHTICSLFGKN